MIFYFKVRMRERDILFIRNQLHKSAIGTRLSQYQSNPSRFVYKQLNEQPKQTELNYVLAARPTASTFISLPCLSPGVSTCRSCVLNPQHVPSYLSRFYLMKTVAGGRSPLLMSSRIITIAMISRGFFPLDFVD